jgi:hypothetical protein
LITITAGVTRRLGVDEMVVKLAAGQRDKR